MTSYAHQSLIQRIETLSEEPENARNIDDWLAAKPHLRLLSENAREPELILYLGGNYAYVNSVVVPASALVPLDKDDLLSWSIFGRGSVATYVTGGGDDTIRVEPCRHVSDSATLRDAKQLVLLREIDGVAGEDGVYFDLDQSFLHLSEIHWRREHQAYCRLDDNGDFNAVLSTTKWSNARQINLASIQRDLLDEYLAASRAVLVRLFDFTRVVRSNWSLGTRWRNEPTVLDHERGFFYRQEIVRGKQGYARGVQIIEPARPPEEIFESIRDRWFGRRNREEGMDFLTMDWRHNSVRMVSTRPDGTTTYFDADNSDLPFEVSPAFFRPAVLRKYTADREKYTVTERDITCRGAWGLRGYGVNDAGQVFAYICYLRNLPISEQLHWKAHNEPPKTGIPQRYMRTDFDGEFVDPTPADSLVMILTRWDSDKVSWWQTASARLSERIVAPRANSRDEWADTFLDLSKCIIEGFVIKAIRVRLRSEGIEFDKQERSLALLQRLLRQTLGSKSVELDGLREIQRIRSKTKAHRSGREGRAIARDALAAHGSYSAHFEHICKIVAGELEAIEKVFAPRASKEGTP